MRCYSVFHVLIGVLIGFNLIMLFGDHAVPPERDFVLAPFGFHDTGRLVLFILCLAVFAWPPLRTREKKAGMGMLVAIGGGGWLLGMLGMALLGLLTAVIHIFRIPVPTPDVMALPRLAGLAMTFMISALFIAMAAWLIFPCHQDLPGGRQVAKPVRGRQWGATTAAGGAMLMGVETDGGGSGHAAHSHCDSSSDSCDSGGDSGSSD